MRQHEPPVIEQHVTFQSTHPSGVRQPTRRISPRPTYFNPRTPVGCDRHHVRSRPLTCPISIHAPQWGATGLLPFSARRQGEFQSTHPSGVRPTTTSLAHTNKSFQSTHPSGVRHAATSLPVIALLFQSTHPSGVRRHGNRFARTIRRISIHAPQWGATIMRAILKLTIEISIHAPQWGATVHGQYDTIIVRFQSTHPSGVRRQLRGLTDGRSVISIHAPQWGATATYAMVRTVLLFQSTHPSGVRQNLQWCTCRPVAISIHAPQWGATSENPHSRQRLQSFQSTHPSGVRHTTCLRR